LKWFIKYIPVRDRPKALYERLWAPGATYYASDFTSFESLFTPDLMEAVEFQLYRYMTQYLPDKEKFYGYLDALKGDNHLRSKWFKTKVKGTRMSGEMNTSLGNGFANLMFWKFLCWKRGSECDGFVEGDDGIFRVNGTAPTAADFASLGLVVKIESHTDLNTASFCGNVFDEKIQTQITEPMFALANLFAIPGKYAFSKNGVHMALLRSKALSMYHQYPKHPILTAAASRLMTLTRSYDVRIVLRQGYLSEWERGQLLDAMQTVDHTDVEQERVPLENRLLVESLHGVTVSQQKIIERKLAAFQLGDVLSLDYDPPQSWADYYREYVTRASRSVADCPPPKQYNYPCSLPMNPDFEDPEAGWCDRFVWATDSQQPSRMTVPQEDLR
jgi:hypothetical protein